MTMKHYIVGALSAAVGLGAAYLGGAVPNASQLRDSQSEVAGLRQQIDTGMQARKAYQNALLMKQNTESGVSRGVLDERFQAFVSAARLYEKAGDKDGVVTCVGAAHDSLASNVQDYVTEESVRKLVSTGKLDAAPLEALVTDPSKVEITRVR